ncbi:MAG: CPXCG motif-containing cysteine-rich protein [Gammaproteobacteria bacterium]
MALLEDRMIDCPYCGETFPVSVDTSGGSHDFIEDCPVCCHPIEFHAEVDDDDRLVGLSARRDDE